MHVMKVPKGERPKRGDLMQTNVGDKRERTWFLLFVRRINPENQPRFTVWRARWWELEPEFRMRLFRSAERSGGQTVWIQEKKKFENLRRPRSKQLVSVSVSSLSLKIH